MNGHKHIYDSTRVSNELGGRRAKAAILAGFVALGTVCTEGIIAAIILISFRTIWGYCYSTDPTVVAYVAQMLILLAILHFFDGIQSVFAGNFFYYFVLGKNLPLYRRNKYINNREIKR